MKIQGIGLPFSSHQSSCSSRVPSTFEWTTDDADLEVWVDNAIPDASLKEKRNGVKRYAWFCESRAILPQLRELFNHDSAIKELVELYDGIFTCEKELVDKHEKIHFCYAGSNLPWISEYEIHDKTKLISFISSSKLMCHGHHLRHQLYERIKKSTHRENTIDVYGSIIGTAFGMKSGCHIEGYPSENAWHDKSEALNDYMFSIVIENDKYDTYFTEKITDCFATGTIPVYYGTDSIGEYFNTDGIIFLDNDVDTMYDTISQLTPAMYHNRMDAVRDNMDRVKNMELADDMLYGKIKELIDR